MVDGFGVRIFCCLQAGSGSFIAAMLQQLFTIILAMILLKEALPGPVFALAWPLLGSLFLSVEKKKT